jgi:protein-tyrosine phosphatase/arsenate reductase
MFPQITQLCSTISQQFELISEDRKVILNQLAQYITGQLSTNKSVFLVYICTHNSRRSHFGQVWAKVAAHYYSIPNVRTFSGGTEATAFNPNAIEALKRDGFIIERITENSNSTYTVKFGDQNSEKNICYSKTYDDEANPSQNFAAVMTCSDAEENCPFIHGVDLRIGTTYDDPKAFDNKPLQDAKYTERSHQIALECLFVMYTVKSKM